MDEPEYEAKVKASLKNILTGDGVVFEINDLDEEAVRQESDNHYVDSEVLDYAKFQCLGFDDEKEYEEEPFEDLAKRMVDVTPDGKIKKMVVRKGYGDKPTDSHQVVIDYNAYVEYGDNPFDSTYVRKKPLRFNINSGETIIGLDVAVQSMQINEKSQFLIHYDYAYGKMGCLDRVPPESTVLFEIELKSSVNYEGFSSYNQLSPEEQKKFCYAYKYAQALCLKAKELFSKSNYKAACKEYNIACGKLEYCVMDNYEEQEKQQALLLRIYTNLVVCNSKLNLPKKVCLFSNKALELKRNNTNLKVPCKVYFNNARALRQLQSFDVALKRLKFAQSLEPTNPEISEEYIILAKNIEEYKAREKEMAKAMMNTKNNVTEDFKNVIKNCCEEIVNKNEETHEFSENLTSDEIECARKMAAGHGLKFVKINDGKGIRYCISRVN